MTTKGIVCLAVSVLFLILSSFFPTPAPAMTEPCELARFTNTDGSFGRSVALSDHLAAVRGSAASGHEVIVFEREGAAWMEVDRLIPADPYAHSDFGFSIAIDGEAILVGAPGDHCGIGHATGSAYLFRRQGGLWQQEAKLMASDPAISDCFGIAVALRGDRLLIGSSFNNESGFESGAAYLFQDVGNGWEEEVKLQGDDTEAGDMFGYSLALGDQMLLIGALGHNSSAYASGAAYVFRHKAGQWRQTAQLAASDGAAFDQFGMAVAFQDNLALVGAFCAQNRGAAYVFRHDGDSWSEEARLAASDGVEGAFFGVTVALAGDLALVGAPDSWEAGEPTGAVYIYEDNGGAWIQSHKVLGGDSIAGDSFGEDLATHGEFAMIGAPGADNGEDPSGAVYLFGLSESACGPLIITTPGPGPHNPALVRGYHITGHFDGHSAFEAYDFGKGYGARVAAGHLVGCGSDMVVTGPGPGPGIPPLVRAFSRNGEPLAQVEFLAYGVPGYGVNVACGDLDGDGFDEIVTGPGPGTDFAPHVRGWTVGFSATLPLSEVNFFAYGANHYGVNVACGDLDGDGYDEIVTGAGPGAVFGPHVRGWNCDGGPARPLPNVSFMAYGTMRWGVNVACGDVDGDGMDEVLTGAGPGTVFGPHVRAWNCDGVSSTPVPALNYMAYGTASWGVRVTSGDLDGDGRDEIVTTPGPGAWFPAHLRTWRFDGSRVTLVPELDFLVFDPSLPYGADAALARW